MHPRGSVIFCRIPRGDSLEFLHLRPLIVVSNQTQMFDTLTVISCGSRDRPGITISLMNHENGSWVNNHQYSIAQPYAIFNVNIRNIKEFHGVIDPYTMKAIDKAMAFHLGLSDIVPPYMEDVFEELYAPKYNMATEDNTQLKDPHQLGSENETTRLFEKRFSNNRFNKDIGKPFTK